MNKTKIKKSKKTRLLVFLSEIYLLGLLMVLFLSYIGTTSTLLVLRDLLINRLILSSLIFLLRKRDFFVQEKYNILGIFSSRTFIIYLERHHL